MRIGVCTTDFPCMPARTLFDRIRAYGFESCQFSFASVVEAAFTPTSDIEIPDALPPRALSRIREAAGEMPFVAANGTFNMAHPDAQVREEGLRRFPFFAEAARELGCEVISLCTGTRSRAGLWTRHADNREEAAWRDMRESVLRALDTAEKLNLTLAVETEASNVVCDAPRARRLLDEAKSERLKMILDGANLFQDGQCHPALVRPVLAQAFEAFGRDIVLAHGKDVAESDGIRFCATGEGIVDFDYMLEGLRRVGYTGDMTLHGIYDETKMPAAVAWMRERIERGVTEGDGGTVGLRPTPRQRANALWTPILAAAGKDGGTKIFIAAAGWRRRKENYAMSNRGKWAISSR